VTVLCGRQKYNIFARARSYYLLNLNMSILGAVQAAGLARVPSWDDPDRFSHAICDIRRAPRRQSTQANAERKASFTSRTAEVAEIVALAAAASGHALVLARSTTAAPGNPEQHPAARTSPSVLFLTTPLLLAAAARAWMARSAARQAATTPASAALARLRAAETALAAQQETMLTLSRQVDKLQTRTRLVSRDMRDQVKMLQTSSVQQGEALLAAALKLEQLDDDVRDVETLVEAVQGLAAKQFGLIQTLAARIQSVQQGHVQSETPTAVKRPPTQRFNAAESTSKTTGHMKEVNLSPTGRKSRETHGVRTRDLTTASSPPLTKHDAMTDEWGRKMVGIKGGKEVEFRSKDCGDENGTRQLARKSLDDAGEIAPHENVGKQVNDDGSVLFSF
jgi:hypothetical protein